ncbi:conjugal transfer protein TraM [Salmonella enterica subsp. enterica serovar Richmond]|nr:conjugal transfer protein TraM [Salmonella enterica subsp. enterica serovar Richmond]EAA2047586.1 conjugal transfer protein TraM [Salmonella enterica subsp. enterica serovar Chester]EAC1168368.1 relaxosome protein TraM [Salmonella enterica subsp. enterica serovar Typhimurium]EAP0132397.1 conjugal transfer protein TraM [Salmonella enterica]EBH3089224.1 relaxosome protein TraM [Salmonella enterica subsp. enterica serovar Poona]EBY6939045.1 relaxosome protein TraM [Salmonella enterica subsp. e
MPRQNVYLKQKTLDEIRNLMDERKAEGATPSDANMSSICSELLEIGLRVTLQMKKREQQEEKNGGLTDEEKFRRECLDGIIKTKVISQNLLKLFYSLEEVKQDSRFNYTEMVDEIKEKAELQLQHALGDPGNHE